MPEWTINIYICKKECTTRFFSQTKVILLVFISIWMLITWVPISSIILLCAITGQNNHIGRYLYASNPCYWRLFHWLITNSGICFQKLRRFDRISECRWLSQMATILTILRLQVLYRVLVIADPRRSCCSTCPVLQKKKHFVRRQKAVLIVLPPEIDQ